MGVIPVQTAEEITFGEVHAPVWAAAEANIGLTGAKCAAVSAAVAAARAAYTQAQAAREAAKAATNNLNVKMSELHPLLAEAVQTIRLFAESTRDPNVYTLGSIPAPAAPRPAPPPTQPVRLSAAIIPGGTLRISFRAIDPTNAGATTYIVSRKLHGEAAFRVVGTAGSSRSTNGAKLPRGFKYFDDADLPAGSNNVQYMVQGQRGAVFGLSSEALTVTIGGGAGNAQTAGLKMAA